jgi:hypothetical protein
VHAGQADIAVQHAFPPLLPLIREKLQHLVGVARLQKGIGMRAPGAKGTAGVVVGWEAGGRQVVVLAETSWAGVAAEEREAPGRAGEVAGAASGVEDLGRTPVGVGEAPASGGGGSGRGFAGRGEGGRGRGGARGEDGGSLHRQALGCNIPSQCCLTG